MRMGSRSFLALEIALDRNLEKRPDQLVAFLKESERRAVAIALIDRSPVLVLAVEQAIEDIVDSEPHRRSEDVLVFNVEAAEPRDVFSLFDLGQKIDGRVISVLEIGAPGELGMRDVVPHLNASPFSLDVADRSALQGA